MAKGKTYYVDHVEANLPWTTKETPTNVKTKGAIKFKDCLVTIDVDNCAKLTVLTKVDAARLRNAERGITRIITKWGAALKEALVSLDINHGPIKRIGGGCGSSFYITDIFNDEDLTMLTLSMAGRTDMRILMPNETHYNWYDELDRDDEDVELYDDEDDEEYA
jgi:hypothetical protein